MRHDGATRTAASVGAVAWVGGLTPGRGLAVPELAGALLLVAWTVAAPVAPLGSRSLTRGAR